MLLSEPIKRSWMTSGASTSTEDRPFSPTKNAKSEMTSDNSAKSSAKDSNNNKKSGSGRGVDGSSGDEEIHEEIDSISSDESNNYRRQGDAIAAEDQSSSVEKSVALSAKLSANRTAIKTSAVKTSLSSPPAARQKLSSPLHTIKESNGKTSPPHRSASSSASSSSSTARRSSTAPSSSKFVTFGSSESGTNRNVSVPTPTTTTNPTDDSSAFNITKADLPGRVSFSKNDVYEIDYSDFENETDASRSPELGDHLRKKNVRFEDEFFKKIIDSGGKKEVEGDDTADGNASSEESKGKGDGKAKRGQKYCCSLKCNTLKCLNRQPDKVSESDRIDESERIIEEYKREIQNINRRHELELKWSGNKLNASSAPLVDYLSSETGSKQSNQTASNQSNEFDEKTASAPSDYWSSPEAPDSPVARPQLPSSNASEDSLTRDSTSTVINNYLKTRNATAAASTSKSTAAKAKGSASILSTAKKAPPPPPPSMRKIKSAQIGGKGRVQSAAGSKIAKARSMASIQSGCDAKLNEFHIDKVESWMSAHEDTFSDAGLGTFRKGKFGSASNIEYKKSWRETPTSKTDDEGNFSLDDQIDVHSMDGSSFGEIELVLKKMEGRCMKISFGEPASRPVRGEVSLTFSPPFADSVKGSVSVPSLSIASSANSHATQVQSHFDNDQSTDKVK